MTTETAGDARHRSKMANRKALQDAEADDLVTEMTLVKHHSAAVVKAREGIEF